MARLVVEVDGAVHVDWQSDPVRDEWLRDQGPHVLRFWNHELLGNLESVLIMIAAIAHGPLPASPSRKGRGGLSPL